MPAKNEKPIIRSGTPAAMRETLKKATTEMLVLFMLRQKSMYVYEMQQEVERLTGGALTFNTMYLAIYRLQEHEYIYEVERRIEGGRARAYLAITEKGEGYFQALKKEYSSFTKTLSTLLARDGKIYAGGKDDA